MSGMSAIIKAQAQIQCNWSDVYIRVSRRSKIGIAFKLRYDIIKNDAKYFVQIVTVFEEMFFKRLSLVSKS